MGYVEQAGKEVRAPRARVSLRHDHTSPSRSQPKIAMRLTSRVPEGVPDKYLMRSVGREYGRRVISVNKAGARKRAFCAGWRSSMG